MGTGSGHFSRIEDTPLHKYECNVLDPNGHNYHCDCDAEEFRDALIAALTQQAEPVAPSLRPKINESAAWMDTQAL